MAKKIYINPGHSNVDPGAVGFERERDLAVKVSNYMNSYLLNNYECETKVTSGSINSLNTVCKEANDWKADLFVSNHFNASKGDGYEALVYSKTNLALGQMFEKYMIAAGQNSRGVKYRPGLAVLRQTNMPAILNEGAFVDNWNDIKDWNDDAELKKMGEAYAKAAADYLNLPKKTVVKAPTTSSTVKETYTYNQFVKEVQSAIGAKVDGIPGNETLSKTVTVSRAANRTHAVVKPLQRYLNSLGYNCGSVDGIAGAKFDSAIKAYQKANGCVADGIITARNKTWKKLLKLA